MGAVLYLPGVTPRQNERPESFVYFIREFRKGGAIKIGRARDPWARVAELATGSSHDLCILAVVPGGAELEREFHREFAAFRLRGEWFHPAAELRRRIAEIRRTNKRWEMTPYDDFRERILAARRNR